MNPKVFLSHASEDKARFVEGFATRLRAKGIDVWLDKWEMLPGDSLVDKIFEEGIKNAQAVIVVLSLSSVSKPWVREELNAGMIKKINTNSKLIPIVIDKCEVPECLKATIWESIKDVGNYDQEFGRILNSILGRSDKPPLGELPTYTHTIIDVIPGLTEIDSHVIKLSCEKVIDSLSGQYLYSQEIRDTAASFGINEDELQESLEILRSRGYIETHGAAYDGIQCYSLTSYGFGEYTRIYIEDYASIVKSVALKIVNEGVSDDSSIRKSLNQPRMVIDHILNDFVQQQLITALMPLAGGFHIIGFSHELKRRIREY